MWKVGLVSVVFVLAGTAETIDPHYSGSYRDEDEGSKSDPSQALPSLMTLFTDPSSVFEAPKYDVTQLSRDGKVHISFCSS